MSVIDQVKKKVKNKGIRIVFPEGEERRIIKAASIIAKDNIAIPILLGERDVIENIASAEKVDLSAVKIEAVKLNPKYLKELVKIRKNKGMDENKAKELLEDEMYHAVMMVQCGDADAVVAGAIHATSDTLRPALQIIKTKDEKIASSFFIILLKNMEYIFADCGMNVEPNAEELAEIAIATNDSAKKLGIEPRIAMLSFSTEGSAEHPLVLKVREATKIVKKKRKDIMIDGEVQVDAAIVPEVTKLKCPSCTLGGKCNILIFPDLNSGNIGYKLVQRFAGAAAIGPIVQGLKKPVNDLSRGCSVDEIVDVAAITAMQVEK